MNILGIGDLHLRLKAPKGRKDDFHAAQMRKLKDAIMVAVTNKCPVILQSGDFFDSADPSNKLITEVIDLWHWFEDTYGQMPVMYTVLGQHDLYLWSQKSIERSALRVLEAAGVLKILGAEAQRPYSDKDYYFYGASWGQDIPEATTKEGRRNVLVTHRSVGAPLWNGHKIATPRSLGIHAGKKGFSLAFVGDYHYPFSYKVGEVRVINAGALMRMTRSDKDRKHSPGVELINIESGNRLFSVRQYLPCDKDVFRSDDSVAAEENREALEALVAVLQRTKGLGTSFEDNLQRYFEENKTSKSVRECIGTVMEEEGMGTHGTEN